MLSFFNPSLILRLAIVLLAMLVFGDTADAGFFSNMRARRQARVSSAGGCGGGQQQTAQGCGGGQMQFAQGCPTCGASQYAQYQYQPQFQPMNYGQPNYGQPVYRFQQGGCPGGICPISVEQLTVAPIKGNCNCGINCQCLPGQCPSCCIERVPSPAIVNIVEYRQNHDDAILTVVSQPKADLYALVSY